MTPDEPFGPGERPIKSWPARAAGDKANRPVAGDLVLTNRRLLFTAKGGVLTRSRPTGSDRSIALETIGGAAPHRTEMRIGYGDRMMIEGVEIAGTVYELGREASSRAILTEIALARQLRRRELGLPDDIAPCGSCGRWIPAGSTLCASCAGVRKVAR
jgi:hypothetical protein